MKTHKCFNCGEADARWAVQANDPEQNWIVHLRFACDEHLVKVCQYFYDVLKIPREIRICLAEKLKPNECTQYSTQMLLGFPVVLKPGLWDIDEMPEGKYRFELGTFDDLGKAIPTQLGKD